MEKTISAIEAIRSSALGNILPESECIAGASLHWSEEECDLYDKLLNSLGNEKKNEQDELISKLISMCELIVSKPAFVGVHV